MRSYDRVKWMVILLPVIFVLLFQTFRRGFLLPGFNPPMVVEVLSFFVMLAAAIFFTYYSFYMVDSLNRNLSREQQTIKAVFNYTSDAIIIIDKDRQIVAMNPAAEALSGFRAENAVGHATCMQVFQCRAHDGGELSATDCCVASLDKNEPVSYFEFNIRNRGGDTIPVTGSCSPLPTTEGGPTLAVIIRDLSERMLLEREVRALYHETARRQKEAETLYEIGQRTTSVAQLEKNMTDVLGLIQTFLEADVVGWAVYDERRSQRLQWRGFVGIESDPQASEGLFEYALEETPTTFRNQHQLPEPEADFARQHSLKSGALAPLTVRDRPVGLLLMANSASARYSDHQLKLLTTVANQLAAAVENVRLYNQVQDTAIMEERERIAREMHDGMAQALTYLNIQLTTVLRRLQKRQFEEVQGELEEMRRLVNEAYGDARQAIYDLKVRLRPGMDFLATLGEVLREFSIANQIEVVFDKGGLETLSLDATVEIQLVRIVQEALANVRKHANATTVTVNVRTHEANLYISVRDDGQGFSTAPDEGPKRRFGLSIMRERAESVSGFLDVESSPGNGAEVRVRVPLRSRGGLFVNGTRQDIASG